MTRASDRFWLLGHQAGSHDADYRLSAPSTITPVDAANYMGIPNIIMVRYGPAAWPSSPEHIEPLRSMREVVFSVVGAGGRHQSDQTARVLQVPNRFPNMTGVMMDDFFKTEGQGDEVAVMPIEDLRKLRDRLAQSSTNLALWNVLYDKQLHLPVTEHLKYCDRLSFWTWKAESLSNLEKNFDAMEQLVPDGCAKVLGCYLWDYGTKSPMPLDAMRHQVKAGWRWLREGRIDGIIFLASCVCDLGLESIEWTREWIAEVGEHVI